MFELALQVPDRDAEHVGCGAGVGRATRLNQQQHRLCVVCHPLFFVFVEFFQPHHILKGSMTLPNVPALFTVAAHRLRLARSADRTTASNRKQERNGGLAADFECSRNARLSAALGFGLFESDREKYLRVKSYLANSTRLKQGSARRSAKHRLIH